MLAIPTQGLAADSATARRDAEEYAIASCLVAQSEPFLENQGDAVGSVVIQRGNIELDGLAGINKSVEREMAKGEIPIIRSESGSDQTLPVLYCIEIIDKLQVRKAIEEAVAQHGATAD
ncbi:hypothetical protein [Jiella pacifica]|uniref:Uncharacterized protein n=1 Tax=Jiella pacifica TaxID=2696469 RepID=A0A6N9SWC5_9HYPH|nr:hypothetical protein [Jiella pacifica]NDW03363.1 hypothetical protein [Jiella pacifica]